MEPTTKSKIATGSALVLAVMAIVMNVAPGLITSENTYACLDPQMAMECTKMSAVNAEGLVTRCYYYSETKERETYKICNTGWVKVSAIRPSQAIDVGDGVLCKVYKENAFIKECKTDANQTYLYIIGG